MRLSLIVLLSLVLASSLYAQHREITPFVGAQSGGSVEVNSQPGDVDSAATFGVMLSFPRSHETMLDFVVAHQSTSVDTGTFVDAHHYDAQLTYAQLGGRYLFKPDERFDPYIALTAGGTRAAIGDEWTVAFSFAAGAGADVRLTQRTSLRLDARYYTTLANASTQVECEFTGGGECSLFSHSGNFTQLALTAGVAVKF